MGDALARRRHQLAGRHVGVEREMVVVAHELQDAYARLALPRQGGRQLPAPQRGRADVAVVALVAHLQRLRDVRLHVDRLLQRAEGGPQRGPDLRDHPPQLGQHLIVVGAEAQRLADSLVEV